MTSADPDRLARYIEHASASRTRLSAHETDVRNTYLQFLHTGSVVGGAFGGLAAVPRLLESMEANERFIAVIRDALLIADRTHQAGMVTIDDAYIAAQLELAGVSLMPGIVPVTASHLLGLPPTSGFVEDPVCTANGNFVHHEVDLAFPARSAILDFSRTYNSLAAHRASSFGPGWTSVLDVCVRQTASPDVVIVRLEDGAEVPFIADASVTPSVRSATFIPLSGRLLRPLSRPNLVLSHTDSGWTLTDIAEVVTWDFDATGVLVSYNRNRAEVRLSRVDGFVTRAHEVRSGRTLEFSWRGGCVVTVSSSDGRLVTFSYVDGHLVSSHRPTGGLSYLLDEDRINEIRDADGALVVHNVYDDTGRVARQQSPFGRVCLYTYGDTGITVVTDTEGSARNAFVHDARGNLTAMVDSQGHVLRLDYDDAGRLRGWIDRRGGQWSTVWGAVGKPISRTGPLGWTQRWEWDDAGRLLRHHQPSGSTEFTYTADNRTPSSVTQADGTVTQLEVDDRDLPVRITDVDGVTTKFHWDSDGQLLRCVDALGRVAAFGYDRSGQVVNFSNPSSLTVDYDLDEAGRVARAATSTWEQRYCWSPAGRATSGADPFEGPWFATYGESGALDSVTDGVGNVTTFDYDAFGNIAEVCGPDDRVYRLQHEGLSRLVAVADPSGANWHYRYDPEGALVEITSPTGAKQRREMDALGRAISEVDAEGRRWTRTWNEAGRIVAVEGPTTTLTYAYDRAGRVVAVHESSGYRAQFTYTAAGRLARRVDSAGNDTAYRYDRAGRLVAMVDNDLQIDLSLDVDRGVISADERKGGLGDSKLSISGAVAMPTLVHNAQGLLTRATDLLGASTHYDYDAAGRLTSATNALGGMTTIDHDVVGRVGAVTDPSGVTCVLDRDGAGVVLGIRHSGATGTRHFVDSSGRVTGWGPLDAVEPSVVRLLDESGEPIGTPPLGALRRRPPNAYDDGRRTDGTGRVVGAADGTVFRHDSIGQLVEWLPATGDSTRYDYDLGGRLVSEHSAAGTTYYDYDTAGKLRRRTSNSDVTDYHYDADGNRIREQCSDGTSVNYQWNAARQLIAISRLDSDANTNVEQWHYDNIGMLVAVDDTEVAWDHTTEWPQVVKIGDSTCEYTGNGIFEVRDDERTRLDTELSTMCSDPWGANLRKGNVTGPRVRLGYRGELCIGDLIWLKARVYDPETRAFLSPDPLPNPPGAPCSANPYHYAWNDPVTNVDPTGLRPLTQEEFDARTDNEHLGVFDKTWEAMRDDPWSRLKFGLGAVPGVGLLMQLSPNVDLKIAGHGQGFGVALATVNPMSGLDTIANHVGGIGSAALRTTEGLVRGIGHGVSDFVTDTIGGVKDFAGFAYGVSAFTLVADPKAWAGNVTSAIQTVEYIRSHPETIVVPLVKDTLAWDTFAKGHYAEGVGEVVFNVGSMFVGVGEIKLAGKAVKATKTAREARVADEAAHLAARDRKSFEEYKDLLRSSMDKPHVDDPKLEAMFKELYRDNAVVGSGSTADAVRYERLTGQPIKGHYHDEKARLYVVGLERWLQHNPTASPGDRAAAENVLRDMKNALEGR